MLHIISSYITLWYVIINIYITYTLRIYQISLPDKHYLTLLFRPNNGTIADILVITTKPFTGKKQICQPFQNYVIDIPWYFGQSYGGGQKILWEGSFTWQILVRKLTPLWILGSHYFCQGKGCKYSGKSESHLKLWASWHSLRARWNII